MLLAKRIEDFFEDPEKLKTFNNLCIHLGFTKDGFYRTMNESEENKELLVLAHERCEAWLIDNGLSNPKSGNFTQFLLRHQFDYVERNEDGSALPTAINIIQG